MEMKVSFLHSVIAILCTMALMHTTKISASSHMGTITLSVGDTYYVEAVPNNSGYTATGSFTKKGTYFAITGQSNRACTIKANYVGTGTLYYKGAVAISGTTTVQTWDLYWDVIVKEKPVLVTSISLSSSSISLEVGEKVELSATVLPSNATDKTVKWTSNNKDVATVSESGGLVEAKGAGEATITCSSTDGSGVTAKCNVKVTGYPVGSHFKGKTVEGHELEFEVLNSETKTCKVNRISNNNITGKVTIPSTANGFKVTEIGYGAFRNCVNVTDFKIPEGIRSMGESAFSWCTSLTSITLSSTVTYLGNQCFYGCKSLESISGESQLEFVGSDAFYNTAMYDKQPDGILYIGNVLYKYKGIVPSGTTIDVKEGTTMISGLAFSSAGSNFDLVIPKSTSVIQFLDGSTGYGALGVCPQSITIASDNPVYESGSSRAIIEKSTNALLAASQKTITIPSTVKIIGDCAFMNYNGETIEIPGSVDSIGHYAFSQTKCKRIYFGSGVKNLGESVLSRSRNIEEIKVSAQNPYFDSRNDCNALIEKSTNKLVVGCKNTVIPESVQVIGEYAFWTSSEGITSLTLSDNVTEIEYMAFGELLELENITFGRNVRKIGDHIFYWVKTLKNIYVLNSTPCELPSTAFENYIYSDVTLNVPTGTVSSYQHADGWDKFMSIVESPSGVRFVVNNESGRQSVYSHSGQRLSAPRKGLNIVDGRKVIVK